MLESRGARIAYQAPASVRRALAVVAGAMLIALSAQLAVFLPGNPVPITFQAAAVVFVGALVGPGVGAGAMALYLMLGAAGLPVFAPTASPGIAVLFGPTGGYLLAMPLAAAIAGQVVRDGRSWIRLYAGLAGGLAAIYAGGLAQLVIVTGDIRLAVQLGWMPFLLFDIGKILIAGLVIRRLASRTRALV